VYEAEDVSHILSQRLSSTYLFEHAAQTWLSNLHRSLWSSTERGLSANRSISTKMMFCAMIVGDCSLWFD